MPLCRWRHWLAIITPELAPRRHAARRHTEIRPLLLPRIASGDYAAIADRRPQSIGRRRSNDTLNTLISAMTARYCRQSFQFRFPGSGYSAVAEPGGQAIKRRDGARASLSGERPVARRTRNGRANDACSFRALAARFRISDILLLIYRHF